VLATGGGGFGSQQIRTFCLSGGVANLSQDSKYQHFTKNNNNISISPNPVDEILTITHDIHVGVPMRLQIIDLNGRTLYENFYEKNYAQNFQVNVRELPAGLYFVQLFTRNEMMIERFVKE